MDAYTYNELLKKVEAMYGLRAEDFAPLTGIPAEMIEGDPTKFIEPTDKERDIEAKRLRELFHIATVLTFFVNPFPITEDEFLREHIDKFINHVPKEAIAKFTGIDVEVINRFMNKEELATEEKYKLAVRFLGMEWLITKNPYIDV